jgi:putative nucleotidyltransferase with HDIG domain
MKREALRRGIASLRDLPTPPRIVHEIWDVLEDRRASASTLAVVLARDTALSARTLRLANSAYFGLPQPVADVRAACVVLGFEMVRGLAVGVAALDGLRRPAGRVLDLDAFWRHSVAVATAARSLARKLGIPDTGTAFCGGMLHDLGRLVLAALEPEACRALLAEGAGAAGHRTREAEAFGAAHDEVGLWTAERWNLAPPLRDAIGAHHAPGDGEAWTRWGALIHVADGIAHRQGCSWLAGGRPGPTGPPPAAAGDADAPVAPPADPAALRLLGVAPEALIPLEESFAAELERILALATAAGGGL